jgi:hypothetical protein
LAIGEGKTAYLKQLSSTNTNGGGWWTAIDSAYSESYSIVATAHPTAGLQWARMSYHVRKSEIVVTWAGAKIDSTGHNSTTPIQRLLDFVSANDEIYFPDGIYNVDTLNVNTSCIFKLHTDAQIVSNLNNTRSIVTVDSVENFEWYNGKIKYFGEYHTVSYGGSGTGESRSCVHISSDKFKISGLEATGASYAGIFIEGYAKQGVVNNGTYAHGNGHAGLLIRGGDIKVNDSFFNRNGGSNNSDGYGIIMSNAHGEMFEFQTSGDSLLYSAISITNCTANENMTRGFDTHNGAEVKIINNHAEANGDTSAYWAGPVVSAYQINLVNRTRNSIVTGNTIVVRDVVGGGIRCASNSGYSDVGLQETIISNNILDFNASGPIGIYVIPYLTQSVIITDNIIKQNTASSTGGAIVVESPSGDGDSVYVQQIKISGNICSFNQEGGIVVRTRGAYSANDSTIYVDIENNQSFLIYLDTDQMKHYLFGDISGNEVVGEDIQVSGLHVDSTTIYITNNRINSKDEDTATRESIEWSSAHAYVEDNYIINSYNTSIAGNYGRVVDNIIRQPRLAGGASTAIINCSYADIIGNKIYGDGSGDAIDATIDSTLLYVIKDNYITNVTRYSDLDLSQLGGSSGLRLTAPFKIDPINKNYDLNFTSAPQLLLLQYDRAEDSTPTGDSAMGWVCTNRVDSLATAEALLGTDTVLVGASLMLASDVVGLQLDSGTYQWTTISSVAATNDTIFLAAVLTDTVSNGANIRALRWVRY